MRRLLFPLILSTAIVAGTTSTAMTFGGPGALLAAPAIVKWPPWLSIESPVNPYDPATRGAAFLIHAAVREGTPTLANLTGTAEGLVGGKRRTIDLRIDSTSHSGVFAVRRQWPSEGTWLLRVTFLSTTAIVMLDRAGNVAGVRIPTELASGTQVPRAVAGREIDSTLADASKR